MDIKQTLIRLGLNDNEATVYTGCLQVGVGPVLAIAKAAELKRPTVYLILDTLEQKGLVSRVQKGNKMWYKAETPEKIITDLKLKMTLATEILPSLKAIYNLDPKKPNIKIAEGAQGVRSIYNGVFTYLSTHPQAELCIFGSLKDAVENFQSSVVDYFYETVGKSQNIIREIGNDDTETRRYYRRSAKLNPRHDIRLIRSEGQFTQTDNMLYGNNLVIFSVKKEIFAIIIESTDIAATYRTLFNMAWRSGKSI